MPPKGKDKPGKVMKRTGEKKRGGKSQLPAHEFINEQTKESYLVEIKELDSRLARYQMKHDELNSKFQQYQQQYNQQCAEQQETVSLYTKTLEQRTDEIADLNDRIIGLQQVKDAEKTMYERQLQQLRIEYKETKDQLISDNMVLGSNLTQLDDFRLRRKELAARLATLERQLQQQLEQHREEIQRLEGKHESGKERLKQQMIERVHEVASEFRKATNRAMAETTKRTIAENVAIESQLTKMADKTSEVSQENNDLQQQIVVHNRQLTDFESAQNDLAKDYVSGCKLIEMLKTKVRGYQAELDQRMMRAEQSQQLCLEADVLREKLSNTRTGVSQRVELCEQLASKLDETDYKINAEDTKIKYLRDIIRKSSHIITEILKISVSSEASNGDVNGLLVNLIEVISSSGAASVQTPKADSEMWAQRKATPLTPLSSARDQKGSNLTARKNAFGSAKAVRHREPICQTSTLSRSSTTVTTQTGYLAENKTGARQTSNAAQLELLLGQHSLSSVVK